MAPPEPAAEPVAGGNPPGRVGFVLGGGGGLGASEVGMLRALLERGIVPDLVVGTSIGALNGAALAASPTPETVQRLERAWRGVARKPIFGSPLRVARTLLRERTHAQSSKPLRQLIGEVLDVKTFEELAVPFQCVAASIERAAEHWFSQGPLVDAILASSAVPGLLPAVEIGGEHFMDGGIVNSIPVARALELGASELYVLHVGRAGRPLAPPRSMIQVMTVAFEIARRHRFARDMAALPPGVVAHVLPTGDEADATASMAAWDFEAVEGRIDRAYGAAARYLDTTLAKPGT